MESDLLCWPSDSQFQLRTVHGADVHLCDKGCGEQKECRKGPARDSPRISAYPTAGKTNSPRLIPAASNPLLTTAATAIQKKIATGGLLPVDKSTAISTRTR